MGKRGRQVYERSNPLPGYEIVSYGEGGLIDRHGFDTLQKKIARDIKKRKKRRHDGLQPCHISIDVRES